MVRKEYEHLMSEATSAAAAYARLSEITEVLRKECPWDREQDHHSLRPCMIEEAYEAADAIDREDMQNMKEELGDVLLQVIFHASLAGEEGEFDAKDVINSECEKMIRRHPHVFLDQEAKTVDKVLEKWENIKVQEHNEDTYTDRLRDVPDALPALIKSAKVQKRAARVGFDWDDATGAFEKIIEETRELEQAYLNLDKEEMREEIGDLLFSVVNVSRFIDVQAEEALEKATAKFINRFAHMEKEATQEGRDLAKMSLDEMDEIWERVKQRGL